MTARLALTAEAEDLVDAFAAALTDADATAWASTIGGARAFCARYPIPMMFSAAAIEEQLRLPAHQRRFASWLMVTARMSVSVEYLARAELRLGTAAARYYPALRTRLAATARLLGSDEVWVGKQWSALAQLAALHGVLPEQLSTEQLDTGGDALLAAFAHPAHPTAGHQLRTALVRLRATLFHAGLTDTPPRLRKPNTGLTRAAQWALAPPRLTETARRYLSQIELSLRPSTVHSAEQAIRELATFLSREAPEVNCVADLTRDHIEAYKSNLASRPRATGGGTLHRHSVRAHLTTLRCFFDRITEWGYPDAPSRPLIFAGDLPIPDQPLPRFLDDAASAKLLRAARADPDPFARLVVELLARTGLRRGELMALTIDAVVQIGSAYWLRVPVGKLHNDRYIPLHPQLKTLFDDWLAERPTGLRSDLVFLDWGRPIPAARVDRALTRIATAAGIGRATAHQLRHTLATQAKVSRVASDASFGKIGERLLPATSPFGLDQGRLVEPRHTHPDQAIDLAVALNATMLQQIRWHPVSNSCIGYN